MASRPARLTGEPRLFALIAVSQLLVALAGFGLEPLRGRTDYAAFPATVYIHAVLGTGWCALAIAQPWLIAARDYRLHRTLGWAGAALALALVLTGIWTTFGAVSSGRQSPPALVLVLNIGGLVPFAALVAAGIQVRRRSDWHRRLLSCATVVAVAPAWARILPMTELGPAALPLLVAAMLATVLWGAVYDRRTRGRIHPAWYWGGFAILSPLLMVPLAMQPDFVAWADGYGP